MIDNKSPLMDYNPVRNFVDVTQAFPNHIGDIDYHELLSSMNLYSILFVEEGDYYGETLVLLKNQRNDYGILNFCWGSCSGCDALEDCDTYEELDELRNQFFQKTHWANSCKELCQWWINRDTAIYESVDEKLNENFVKILRTYINIDDEYTQKIKIRENLYNELLKRISTDDLRGILEHDDWYGSGIWELSDETVKELIR